MEQPFSRQGTARLTLNPNFPDDAELCVDAEEEACLSGGKMKSVTVMKLLKTVYKSQDGFI